MFSQISPLLRPANRYVLPFLFLAASLEAKTVTVNDAAQFDAACREAKPGDTLLLRAGEWKDARLVFRANGSASAPITLTAEKPGAVKLTGSSTLNFAGDHLVVSGLVFTEGHLERGAIVAFRTDGQAVKNCRLTDTAFIRYNPPDPATRYPWVQVYGQNNRVDHCRFEGQNHRGITLQILVGEGPNHHQIDHNHFLDRAPGGGNGYETMQLAARAPSHSIVELNLFEACDGEQEIISNKSEDNIYRLNTFRRCAGALTLRDGARATVENNVFIGEGKPGTAGVRAIDSGHIIRGNYFHGLTGHTTMGGIIALYAGIPPRERRLYATLEDVLVADNILIDNAANGINLSAGYRNRERTVLPRNVTVRGNWIDLHPRHSITVLTGTPGEGLLCEDNFYSGNSELGYAPPSGFTQTPARFDPDAIVPLQPELSAPATEERGGWSATMNALKPLTARDVGPAWWQHP
jgi:hypothetical protein